MNIETILDGQITVSMIVAIMAKIAMVLLLLLTIILLRQTTLMDRVIKLSVGRSIKMFVLGFLALILLLTVIVIIV